MDYVDLGNTGLKTSVAGLGCGGHSRLGQAQGARKQASADIVRAALDRGINLIDTAAAYRTEKIVGKAIKGQRDKVILSTKAVITKGGFKSDQSAQIFQSPADIRASLEGSLKKLGTDYVDVLHLHGVDPTQYGHCREHLVPELIKFQEEGKIRFLGITERFVEDPSHKMLEAAVEDGIWQVVMVGFNMLNPSARTKVLAKTQEHGIGTLDMFAVRRALSNPDALGELVSGLVESGALDPAAIDANDPLGFVWRDGNASSITDAAYRFCRHEPGIEVVLTGTGKTAHLEQNIASICAEPLDPETTARLAKLFGHIDSVSGN